MARKAKKVIIAGGSGFIGQALSTELLTRGYEVSILTRGNDRLENNLRYVHWSSTSDAFKEVVAEADFVINLAGESIASGLWTETKKERMLQSRLQATDRLVAAVNESKKKPTLFLQASAIGYYGSRADEILTEESSRGRGFLADLVHQWEMAAQGLKKTPLAVLRIGLVLGPGGMLQRLRPVFKAGLGGHIGSGEQYMSWIHISDIVGIIVHLLEKKQAGVYNLVAPEPVTGREFFKTLGSVLSRPSWLHVPSFVLKLAPGDMGEELFLASQRVQPAALKDYDFQYADLKQALDDLQARDTL